MSRLHFLFCSVVLRHLLCVSFLLLACNCAVLLCFTEHPEYWAKEGNRAVGVSFHNPKVVILKNKILASISTGTAIFKTIHLTCIHTLSSPLTTEYLALAAHLFHHPCQHSCHVAEHWAEKSPAVPSHAPSSPPLSFAARSACPPPGDHQPCKKTQKKDIRLSDSRQNNTEDFQKVSSHLTVLSHELYWFTYNQAEDKQTCWTRDSLLSSDCSSNLLALCSSCPIWGQRSKNNLHEQVFQNLNSIRV